VFVDVHKAIRRLHPVAYYRVPRQAPNGGNKKDVVTERGDVADGTNATNETGERKYPDLTDPRTHSRGPIATLIRRQNSGGLETLSVMRNAEDLRPHLKHLGPSNVASNPKSTRINAVKIKPALGAGSHSPTLSPLIPKTTGGGVANLKSIPTLDGGRARSLKGDDASNGVIYVPAESTGLLSTAGGFPAQDGTHAVGYGTLSSSPRAKRTELADIIEAGGSETKSPFQAQFPADQGGSSSPPVSPQKENQRPESSRGQKTDGLESIAEGSGSAVVSEGNDESSSSLPAKLVVSLETNLHGSDEETKKRDDDSSGGSPTPQPLKGMTRSGSILERDVDLKNGVRKVVLDVLHDEHSNTSTRPRSSTLPQNRPDDGGGGSGSGGGDEDGGDEPEASETAPLLSPTGEDAAGTVVAKKKRKKKKKSRSKKQEGSTTSPAATS
jgi:hypothetical protein